MPSDDSKDRAPDDPRPAFASLTPHLMALAPLDVWARVLLAGGDRRRLAYVPRGALAIATSVAGTIATLPERVLLGPGLAAMFRGPAPVLDHKPGVVVILGYFRSGTTHLHNLLSCDPRLVTPTWSQAMAPGGWALGWSLVSFAMIPFAPNERPQDDVAFGPSWPAEDDFAMANWCAASSLPGRFIYPSRVERWGRWDDLGRLTPRELRRFRRTMAAFCWKVVSLKPGRRLLLKSPSHTARVAELDRLFGGNVRFIHIAREPEAVIGSNAAMHERMRCYLLEDPPSRADTRAGIAHDYLASEEKFLRESEALGDDRLARIGYRELIDDPLGTARRVYRQLGMTFDDRVESAFSSYLRGVSDYRAGRKRREGEVHVADPGPDEPEIVERLNKAFPEVTRAPGEPETITGPAPRQGPSPWGWIAAPVGASVCLGAWLGIASLTGDRLDTLTWLWGVLVGWATLVGARRGDWRLGMWAAAWFLIAIGASVWPMPQVQGGWTGEQRLENIRSTYLNFPNSNQLWLLFGTISAYRFASRRHVRPPGR